MLGRQDSFSFLESGKRPVIHLTELTMLLWSRYRCIWDIKVGLGLLQSGENGNTEDRRLRDVPSTLLTARLRIFLCTVGVIVVVVDGVIGNTVSEALSSGRLHKLSELRVA